MLTFCIYMLNQLRTILKAAIDLESTKRKSKNKDDTEMTSAYFKVRNLMICEILLAAFSLMTVIYEVYVIINVYQGNFVTNIYAESTIMSVVAYFPTWTFTHIVLLLYGWIPKEQIMENDDNKNIAHQIQVDMSMGTAVTV